MSQVGLLRRVGLSHTTSSRLAIGFRAIPGDLDPSGFRPYTEPARDMGLSWDCHRCHGW